MPTPISYPLTPLLKIAFRVLAPLGPYILGESLLDQLDPDADSLEWRHLQVIQTRSTPVGTVEDKAMITFDLLNVTGGAPDSSWIEADYTAAETRVTGYLSGIASLIHSQAVWTELRWYRRAFANPIQPDHRFEPTGEPQRITTIAIPGSGGTDVLPYQCAMSFTERTAWPKHWGRWYLPTLSGGITAQGRFGGGDLAVAVDAAANLLLGLRNDDLPLVVPSTQQNGVLGGYLLVVTEIAIDDVPDVQRRRRPRQVANRLVTVD